MTSRVLQITTLQFCSPTTGRNPVSGPHQILPYCYPDHISSWINKVDYPIPYTDYQVSDLNRPTFYSNLSPPETVMDLTLTNMQVRNVSSGDHREPSLADLR